MLPKVTIDPKNRFELQQGKNGSLSCNGTGYPAPNVVWKKIQKNGNLVTIGKAKTLFSILTLKNVSVFLVRFIVLVQNWQLAIGMFLWS